MKGEQVATVAYIVAALLALLSIAGFVHAVPDPEGRSRSRRPSTYGITARWTTSSSSASELRGTPRSFHRQERRIHEDPPFLSAPARFPTVDSRTPVRGLTVADLVDTHSPQSFDPGMPGVHV